MTTLIATTTTILIGTLITLGNQMRKDIRPNNTHWHDEAHQLAHHLTHDQT